LSNSPDFQTRTVKITMLLAAAMATAAAWATNVSASPHRLRRSTVLRLERLISLPEGAYELKSYDRFYALRMNNGRRRIVGIFVHREHGTGQSHIVRESDLPMWRDGGCSVLELEADFTTAHVNLIACHGEV
jgi:hypothetical protein